MEPQSHPAWQNEEGEGRIRKYLFRALALAMLLALVMGCLPAMAAAKVKIVPQTLWFMADNPDFQDHWVHISNLPKSAKLLGCVSSNEAVVSIPFSEAIPRDEEYVLNVKKPGKAKITVTYKVGAKKRTVSATYTVKKAPKVVSKLVFDGRKVNLNENGQAYYFCDGTPNKYSHKIGFTPAKGWKIVESNICDYEGNVIVSVKNNKTFKLPKKLHLSIYQLVYVMKNSKGDIFYYQVDLMPE